MCSIIWTITSIPMSFVTMYLFNRFNSAWILRLGAFFFLSGNFIRLGWKITDSFAPVLIGCTVISLSQSIYICAITLVCNKWFPDSERDMAISICALSVPGGNILSFLQTGFLFRGVTLTSPTSLIKSTMNKILIEQFYVVLAIAVPFMLVIRSEPKQAPSLVSLKNPKQEGIIVTLKKVVKNRDFMFLCVVFGMLYGTFVGFGGTLSVLFEPKGFTSSEIAGLGLITVICGVIGSFITGILLQKYHKYSIMLISSAGIATFLLTIGMITF